MGMYQRVSLMQINGLLDMPTDNLIYIYKITSKYTGHYYFGQTKSVKDRMYQHLSSVIKLIEGKPCKPQQLHKVISEKIKELHLKDKRTKLEKFTRDALSVYIIALVAEQDAANLVERLYINRFKYDKLCLNVKGSKGRPL